MAEAAFDGAADSISRLVFDGVLEVLDHGRFVSGTAAADLLRDEGEDAATDPLSRAALRYGQELARLGVGDLALRLYGFGRRPLSPRLLRSWRDPTQRVEELLPSTWVRAQLGARAREHWREWAAPDAARERSQGEGAGYKLYLSPAADAYAPALETLLAGVRSARGLTGFKIAAGPRGVARPDKVVAYFAHLDDLRQLAHDLERELEGCPAHGVPFTAAIDGRGLLSWGADPPRPDPRSGRAVVSWRAWVTERLAEHLAAAADAGAAEPWRFALERLRLAGIDTRSWIPATGGWPRALAAG